MQLSQDNPPETEQEIVQIRVVGSRRSALKIIHHLYLLGFAAVSDWSPQQPGSQPGEFGRGGVPVPARRSAKYALLCRFFAKNPVSDSKCKSKT